FTDDRKPSLGIGIKLFGVPGTKLLHDEKNATTHDFLMQNSDVFFVDTALDMCEWAQKRVNRLPIDPETEKRREKLSSAASSVLDSTYWSVLPYAYGRRRYVKYKL